MTWKDGESAGGPFAAGGGFFPPGSDPAAPPPPGPGETYMRWAAAYFNAEAKFGELKDTYPELRAPARRFDQTIAAFHLNHMVVVAFKKADGLGYAGAYALLKHLDEMVPKAGQFDALAFYGLLVLVYEKPLNPRLRDQLVGLKRRSLFGGKMVQLALVELDAKAVWTTPLPTVIGKLFPLFQPINDALGKTGEPPPLEPPPPRAGQRARATDVAYGTIALILVCVAVEVGVLLRPADVSDQMRKYQLGLGHVGSIAAGDWWRLVTSAFLHGDWLGHLGGNLCGLMVYGMTVEQLFGTGWTLAIFLATAVSGNLLGYWTTPEYGGWLGASGGIMGFFGVLVAIYLFRRNSITPRTLGFLIRGTAVYLVWTVLVGWVFTGAASGSARAIKSVFIDNQGHLGGWVTGFLLGLLVPFPEPGRPSRAGTALGLAAAAVCLLCGVEMLAAMGWVPTEYRTVHDGNVLANLQVPERWAEVEQGRSRRRLLDDLDPGEVDNPRVAVYTNGISGVMVLAWSDEHIDGILTTPTYALRDEVGDDFRRSMNRTRTRGFVTVTDEVADFAVTRMPLGGGVGIGIRATLRTTAAEDYAGWLKLSRSEAMTLQILMLPCRTGYLTMMLMYDPEDARYYQPIFTQVESTLQTTEPVSMSASAYSPPVQ